MNVQIKCICPSKADGSPRHDHDTVTLPDRLSFRQLVAIRQNLGAEMQSDGITQGEVVATLIENYVLVTPVAWTVVDEKGKPLPLSRQNVIERLLGDHEAAEAVGEAADNLYSDTVTLPLRNGASNSSQGSPQGQKTSQRTGRGTKRPTPLKPSSTSTTPMAVTGPMAASPAGGSSFSQS